MLMDELPVRLANRIAHLENLALIDEIEEMLLVRADFVKSFAAVRRAKRDSATPEQFAKILRELKQRHATMIHSVSLGMREWKMMQMHRGMKNQEARVFVDEFLDRLFLSKIGLETLTSQYLAIFNQSGQSGSKSPGAALQGDGVIDANCDPCKIIQKAADKVQDLAFTQLRKPPKVEISYHGEESERMAPLIPAYLFYITAELLKNSVRAVAELHEMRYGDTGTPEPVRVRVSSDASQVGVQIFDRGGGIPFDRQPHIWSYNYTTAKGARICDETGSLLKGPEAPTPLAGFGVGLPLSRLYAEYIGGSLHVMSMPNFGTHAYLFLQRCAPGERAEALPTFVNWQQKRRLKDRITELNTHKLEAVELEEYFEAGRIKAKINELKAELSAL
mmetsp:Transcript_22012/g.56113  ORF Transcript_22012/g.56113 Transcript_22012/m.56113 type:complete len:390 (+) Transcript_22012:2-1171(+)